MTDAIPLHPDLGPPKRVEINGEDFVNVAGVMALARDGDTPECRSLVRFFNAEHRALAGQPITDMDREWQAFRAAWSRMVRKFGVAPIGPERKL